MNVVKLYLLQCGLQGILIPEKIMVLFKFQQAFIEEKMSNMINKHNSKKYQTT